MERDVANNILLCFNHYQQNIRSCIRKNELSRFSRQHSRVFVVAVQDKTIYGFRGDLCFCVQYLMLPVLDWEVPGVLEAEYRKAEFWEERELSVDMMP